jgi:sugar phosphate isomerase/epimerase
LIREVSRNRFEQSYRIGKELQTNSIVFHHGFVPHTSSPGGWIKRATEFWLEFLEGKDESIKFFIENHLDNDYRIVSDLIDSIDRPNVKVNLDVGHAHFVSDIVLTRWIEKLGKRIGYVHIHDNHGHNDEHLGIGSGSIPMKEVCEALNEYSLDAIWALESDEKGILQSLRWLGENRFIGG